MNSLLIDALLAGQDLPLYFFGSFIYEILVRIIFINVL